MVKILAIDDKRDNLLTLSAVIRESIPDSILFTTQKGFEGIEIAIREDPDVILLDIIMPHLDGFEVCRLLKRDERLSEIPVVFLTAIKGDPESRIKALEAGAEAFLAKPIDRAELIAQIRAMVKIRESNRQKHQFRQTLIEQVKIKTSELELAHAKALNLLGELRQEIEIRKITENELILAKEKAEESDRLKSAFLANISHEVRTPMNAITGFSDLLMEATVEKREEYIGIIRKSSAQLLNLITDVMLIARLQSEKLPVTNTFFKPFILINEVFQMFSVPGFGNGLDCRISVPTEFRETVIESDQEKIRHVLTNLISNALKYTKAGSVTVGFLVNTDEIEFFVEDTGLGITEKEKERIFDNFYRGERIVSMAIGGSGLGLAIVKGLLELIGGKIGFHSVPNQGSRFHFRFNSNLLRAVAGSQEAVKSPRTSWNDLVILIAEDEPENFTYLDILLKKKVKRIDHVWNGQMAIEMASANQYDMILMDIKMPVLGGLEATPVLKKLNPGIPIIAQTAFSFAEEVELARQAGCDDFISKPINKEKLYELIDKYAK